MMAMLHSLQNRNTEVTVSQEVALQTAAERISTEVEVVVSQLAAAVSSFALLHNDIVSQLVRGRESY